MKQLNIRNYLRRFMAVALAGIMAASLSATAFAAELCPICGIPDCTCCTTGSGSPNRSGTVATVTGFSDVPSTHTFYTGIMWCAEQGIVGGYSDGTFRPTNTVTKSNFSVMLSRAFYADEVAIRSTESNLKYGAFFPNFVTLRINNVLEGTSFSTNTDIMNAALMNTGINRYDMAQMMNNVMLANGFSASSADKNAAISKISDYNGIPSQYKDAVATVYALGVIGGYADGSFGGTVTMNRGQAAIVIYRMMQKMFPNGEVGTPDPEVPTDPSTGEMACSCIQLTGECKCNNMSSTGTGSGTTTPVTPERPGDVTAKVLRDGSTVTEANALKIIEQVKQVYPNGTDWDSNTYRNNDITIGGRKLGGPSVAIITVSNAYATSMTGGCGGFAGVVSDAIFGGRDNGGENFPVRKLSSLADIRPGDIISKVDGNGKNMHFLTAASSVTNIRTINTGSAGNVTAYDIATYEGNRRDKVVCSNQSIYAETYQNVRYEAWTRYPD